MYWAQREESLTIRASGIVPLSGQPRFTLQDCMLIPWFVHSLDKYKIVGSLIFLRLYMYMDAPGVTFITGPSFYSGSGSGSGSGTGSGPAPAPGLSCRAAAVLIPGAGQYRAACGELPCWLTCVSTCREPAEVAQPSPSAADVSARAIVRNNGRQCQACAIRRVLCTDANAQQCSLMESRTDPKRSLVTHMGYVMM